MARLSDVIEAFIKEMLKESEEDELEIQRNELANYFSCAPSQINYVLTTRFTTDKGYCIESRRGGGGCIKIRRIEFEGYQTLADIINEKIGDSITYDSAVQIIDYFFEQSLITEREAQIMKIAVNDRTLSSVNDSRNKLRADILKSIIVIVLK